MFRQFKDDGQIMAMFPEIPYDVCGDFCVSYMQCGQHHAASPSVGNNTRPVKHSLPDYLPLLRELASIGYTDLKEVQRVSGKMHLNRRINARGAYNIV